MAKGQRLSNNKGFGQIKITLMFFTGTLLLVFFCPKELLDSLYSNGLYPLIRWLVDPLSNRIGFPFLYVALPLLVVLSIYRLVVLMIRFTSPLMFLRHLSFYILRAFMILIIIFYWSWGINYKTAGFFERQLISLAPVSMDHVESEYLRITDTLNTYSPTIDTLGWDRVDKSKLQYALKDFLKAHYRELNYSPSVHEIRPRGWMMRIGAQGVYLPWLGQGHIDAGLHDIQKPFTYLHEMTHGFGITHEGECNFIAYQLGVLSDDPFVRYSAYVSYWRYLAFQMAMIGCHDKDLMNNIFKEHIYSIYRNSARYPDIFPRFRRKSYDLYLKAQGIEEGMESYSELIMMQYAWENRANTLN